MYFFPLVPKTWRRELTSKSLDTDNRGSDNREPTVPQCHGKVLHFAQILALVGKSNKTHDSEENQQESEKHSDDAAEQLIQFVMVLTAHVACPIDAVFSGS